MEEYLSKHRNKKDEIVFAPPQIFTRNYLDVPIVTRVFDTMLCFSHTTQLPSVVGISFPLSNYSISYAFIKSVGFWDTCADAIGEDFHTTQKAFWKSKGKMTTVPIYVPFNQVNLATGNGYMADCKARFWQAERHAQGVADMAYNINMLLKTKFRLRNLAMFYLALEMIVVPGVLPWVFISLIVQQQIVFRINPSEDNLFDTTFMFVMFTILNVFSAVSYILFEGFKRRSNSTIYKKKNESILRLLEYPLLFTVNLFVISIPAFTHAAFSVLFANRTYIVADKKNTSSKPLEDLESKVAQLAM